MSGEQPTTGHPHSRITAPRLIHQVEAVYTDVARQRRIEGVVKIQVDIGADGGVYRPQVRQQMGYGLDEAALAAVQQWKFEPATANGTPISVAAVVDVTFRLPPVPDEPPQPAAPPPSGERPKLTASELRRGVRYCGQCNKRVKASPLGYCPKCGERLARR